MKKLYKVNYFIRVNDGDIYPLSLFPTYEYSERDDTSYTYSAISFQKGLEMVQDFSKFIDGLEIKFSLFKHNPKIIITVISDGWYGGFTKKIKLSKRNFKRLTILENVEVWNPPITEVMSQLSTESFCEYLKDKGIEFFQKNLKKTIDKSPKV